MDAETGTKIGTVPILMGTVPIKIPVFLPHFNQVPSPRKRWIDRAALRGRSPRADAQPDNPFERSHIEGRGEGAARAAGLPDVPTCATIAPVGRRTDRHGAPGDRRFPAKMVACGIGMTILRIEHPIRHAADQAGLIEGWALGPPFLFPVNGLDQGLGIDT